MSAKSKAKTVKVRVAVVYNDKGAYQAGGYDTVGRAALDDDELVGDAYDVAAKGRSAYPFVCIVDVELPIPQPLKAKRVKVRQVKR